jgi:methylenetetrahydrofolate dehydrogenase (NADP+)/methenyltetrahydrofolate cyclohydrolase
LLKRSGVQLSGAEAVIVGRSNIVGLPVAMLLQKDNATVTICHSRTRDLAEHTRRADILVAAIGRREMITGDMVKPGAAVIDVGINQKEDPTKKRGYRLVGDVDFDSAKEVAGAITPVPGGVGPMTIAMLLNNTHHAAEIALGI